MGRFITRPKGLERSASRKWETGMGDIVDGSVVIGSVVIGPGWSFFSYFMDLPIAKKGGGGHFCITINHATLFIRQRSIFATITVP